MELFLIIVAALVFVFWVLPVLIANAGSIFRGIGGFLGLVLLFVMLWAAK